MVDSATGDLKKQLTSWISYVMVGVEKKLIGSEQDLEAKVRVLSEKDKEVARYNSGGIDPLPTLLELLGYTDVTCDDHPIITYTIAGHKLVKIIPDYIVKSAEQKDLAIWELKAPTEDIDSKESVNQLLSYCTEPKRQTGLNPLDETFS